MGVWYGIFLARHSPTEMHALIISGIPFELPISVLTLLLPAIPSTIVLEMISSTRVVISLLIPTCLFGVAADAWMATMRPLPTSKSWSATPLPSSHLQEDIMTGQQQHLGKRYLLTSEQHTSSGKSTIYKGYKKCDETGQPTGDAVAIKVSGNTQAFVREARNFHIVDDELFVETHEYIEPLDDDEEHECDILHQGNGALVMELGSQDLKGYLNQNGPLVGEELRSVARRCVECVENLHRNGMVWTEMKSENFIRQECGTVKGIDLESAGE